MVREAMLIRTADRVVSYINQYVTLAGAEKKEEVLRLFDSMHQFFPHWVIMTCPVMHPHILYASKNCEHVFGYPDDYLMNEGRVERFFALVHPDDQAELYECFAHAHDYLETVIPDEHYKYRTIYYYRMKKANGQYMYLHDEKATLNIPGSGQLYYGLFRDITTERPFAGVKVELYRQEETLNKIQEYKPSARRNPLSKRETELVDLVKQGLTTKEIAWYLKISHNTVRNIKSKLFEKYNVSNIVELLNKAG